MLDREDDLSVSSYPPFPGGVTAAANQHTQAVLQFRFAERLAEDGRIAIARVNVAIPCRKECKGGFPWRGAARRQDRPSRRAPA